jgi:Methyltransferase domain
MRPRHELSARLAPIGIRRNYDELDLEGVAADVSGWFGPHPLFAQVIREVRPRVVVEVGTWKGASLLHLRELTRQEGLDTAFVCVDTWLGSNPGIWLADDDRAQLLLRGGYPSMFRQFVRNLIEAGATEDVFPLPMTSTCGARVLERLGLEADVVYVDAGHEEEEVAADIDNYWSLLRGGGAMLGDDYDARFPGVVAAVGRIARRRHLRLETHDYLWLLRKPQTTTARRAGRPSFTSAARRLRSTWKR